jgi:hypothetical protein
VTPSGTAWFSHNGRLGFISKATILSCALGVSLLPFAVLAFAWGGRSGVISAVAACAVCLVAGLNGLGLSVFFQSRANPSPFTGLLASMLVRMGLPLGLVLVLVVQSHPLLESGFVYYLIAFYQVMLFVELMLIVPRRGVASAMTAKHNGIECHGG